MAPLPRLIEEAYHAIEPHVRERQQLVDLFFEERLEYPAFAWQEAIVNAVAHRDYRFEGTELRAWMFDDRLEVHSPGALVEPVTLKRLREQERVHASRNPRIVRALTDFGYMREQGEGVPRMFEAMEREGLYPPEFSLAADIFTVTLKNTPIYGMDTIRWLGQYESHGLSGNQKRLLAYAKEHGNRFTSHVYQQLVGIDIYAASRDIKDLIRRGIVRLPQKRGRVYEVLPTEPSAGAEMPPDYAAIEPLLRQSGYVTTATVRETLGISPRQARHTVARLVKAGLLRPVGALRTRRYVPGE